MNSRFSSTATSLGRYESRNGVFEGLELLVTLCLPVKIHLSYPFRPPFSRAVAIDEILQFLCFAGYLLLCEAWFVRQFPAQAEPIAIGELFTRPFGFGRTFAPEPIFKLVVLPVQIVVTFRPFKNYGRKKTTTIGRGAFRFV